MRIFINTSLSGLPAETLSTACDTVQAMDQSWRRQWDRIEQVESARPDPLAEFKRGPPGKLSDLTMSRTDQQNQAAGKAAVTSGAGRQSIQVAGQSSAQQPAYMNVAASGFGLGAEVQGSAAQLQPSALTASTQLNTGISQQQQPGYMNVARSGFGLGAELHSSTAAPVPQR